MGMAGRARFGEVLELFDRELCQHIKLERRIDGENAVHQRRLSGRNAVFPRLLRKSRVLRQRLRQDGRPRFACLQNTVHGARQLALEFFRASGILVLHRDHDGGGNAVEISRFARGPHDGVHRHVELCALEICAVAISARMAFASSLSGVQTSTFSLRFTFSSMLGFTSSDTTEATAFARW